ncbi:MAG TPA: inositol monophosphatase family protein [Thermoanaerobaculaceae bacterium]|nr:inositol monophosphatase family protein [Thermoanaerobaculaceae bacterium]HPS78597.1 inositol monophosphatase family protein [Thermoanaerobaculaceae bacterium]
MRIDSIAKLEGVVRDAGRMALARQRAMRFSDRSFKDDGSIITATDSEVEKLVADAITVLFPFANVLGEESVRRVDPARPYTFAVDPIDGTDSFSQGLPGWCISIGLLDGGLEPVAGIVFAPVLDMLVLADVGCAPTCNGAPAQPGLDRISPNVNLMLSSRLHQDLDLSGFVGKIRSLGSAALQLCAPWVFPGVIAALQGRGAHIWDIAGAHAIARAGGGDLEWLRGGTVDYSKLMDGSGVEDVIVAGSPASIAAIRGALAS